MLHLRCTGREEEIVTKHVRRDGPPDGGRSKRLEVVRTLLQFAQTVLVLFRLMGGC